MTFSVIDDSRRERILYIYIFSSKYSFYFQFNNLLKIYSDYFIDFNFNMTQKWRFFFFFCKEIMYSFYQLSRNSKKK